MRRASGLGDAARTRIGSASDESRPRTPVGNVAAEELLIDSLTRVSSSSRLAITRSGTGVRAELTATCPGCEVGIGFGRGHLLDGASIRTCRPRGSSTEDRGEGILDQFAAFPGFVVGEPPTE